MKKIFLNFGVVFFAAASLFAADVPTTLNINLVASNFDAEFHCGWKSQRPLKFWMGPVEDARPTKDVGILLIKNEETPLQSSRPMTALFQEALQKGLNKCGFTQVNHEDLADIVVRGRLDEFSGTSKKGFFKGEAKGKAEFTLNLSSPQTHEELSTTFGVEENQKKGISKNPKKLEKILNNLLTRLTLDVFHSRQVSDWFASRK
ncbi:MAG: hypothetical protein A3H42_04725 [Deltaproteobacteria bacterium RIFCSPLOWO2_02_FULL_46_8]|nr:MAG: hypothetical protein A3H42_04725 [Deltaproteobacteria bacterium RIFCSPLOWO2_02_FULL_46_8]